MVVVDHLVHKYDEILSSVHHEGHPASHHGPPVGEGHGGASPKIQPASSSTSTHLPSRWVPSVVYYIRVDIARY